jgi:hypothetical protein
MSNKPSKEQLEIYFKSSRKYFDSLAEQYKKTDPDYYNQVMRPVMYKNVFSGGSNVRKPVLPVLIGVFVAAIGIAVAAYFTMMDLGGENNTQGQKIERSIERVLPDTARAKRDNTVLEKDSILKNESSNDRRLKEKKAERIY